MKQQSIDLKRMELTALSENELITTNGGSFWTKVAAVLTTGTVGTILAAAAIYTAYSLGRGIVDGWNAYQPRN